MSVSKKFAKPALRILLAQPRGFCAGVERAIEIVEQALKRFGPPVYVRHEIVHNRYVVDSLRKKGAVFVKEVDEIPEGAVTIFSAHGVSDAVEQAGKDRGLHVIDAACPLVTKVHNEGQRYARKGFEVVL
ncbi:MAG: 4-hydroxy-3-methylbut-2-enyl diphosphate reductase, partial [Pseudomonadota bacterium]